MSFSSDKFMPVANVNRQHVISFRRRLDVPGSLGILVGILIPELSCTIRGQAGKILCLIALRSSVWSVHQFEFHLVASPLT